jgi:hypothetical protein
MKDNPRISFYHLGLLTEVSMSNQETSRQETTVYSELDLGVGGTISLAFNDNEWKVKDGSLKYLAKENGMTLP